MQKSESIRLMGTVIDLLIEHVNPEPIMNEAVNRLKMYEQRFSANDSASELMKVNHNAGIQPITVHTDLYDLIKIGKFHSCAPNSHLNIAIGPLVQTWRIGFDDAKVPSTEEINRLLQITDPQKIILDDEKRSVYLEEAEMLIDLGALAKGYIADLIVEYLKRMNVTSALINLGGNIVALGPSKEDQKKFWKIGIQNPLENRNQSLLVLKAINQSIVTSGIYERSLESEGDTYHHILDPQTGYPMTTDVASLTIVSNQSVDGEIWTTRLFGHSSTEMIHSLNQLDGIEGLVITKDYQILYSNGLKELIL